MREVVEIGLAFIDLIKAEFEQSKRAVFNLGIALALAVVAAVFLVCAVGLMLYAAYLAFLPALGQELAVFSTGLAALVCAGVLLWVAAFRERH